MSSKSKSFQKSADGMSYVIPREVLESQVLELPAKAIKQLSGEEPRPKRALSEKQQENVLKLVEMNKERKRLREEAKAKVAEEEKEKTAELNAKISKEILKPARIEKKKLEEEEKINAGSHVRVMVKPKFTRKKRAPVETETETETDFTETETETETDVEEYKSRSRQARKAQVAKKLVKTVEKIDRVIQQQPPVNPYTAMLAGRWR